MMNKGDVPSDRPAARAAPRAQKSSQLNRGIGLVAATGEVVVAAAMVVTVVDEDVDGAEDRRSNVSHLAVGGAAVAGCCCCWKFRRCETGGGRGAWALLALAAGACLARMASSVPTCFCTRFS
jgi:hypothetical protein